MDGADFRFEYDPGVIRHGRGCVADLDSELARQGCERGLVVCGQTVGTTPAVIDPVRDGLGDALAGVFAETTPDKRLATAVDGAERLAETEADAIVALGGGSSLDVAKAISAIAASDEGPETLAEQFEASGLLPVPDDPVPIIAIPTTLAGADISILGGLSATPNSGLVSEVVGGGIMSPALMPTALFYDANLVETTPREILAASAMNGFDKGIETLYACNGTPITDATAMRGTRLLWDALPTLSDEPESWATDEILQGIVLVQYGISRPDGTTLSLIHAFGHALTVHSDVQQGAAHAIVAPHALRYLFEHVDGRRELLAEAFAIDTDALSRRETAEAIVEEVAAVRDALGLPSQLRSIDDLDRDDLDAIAQSTIDDSLMANVPPGLDATADEIEAVLADAW
jgi:alcohol dehydrogenase class IV